MSNKLTVDLGEDREEVMVWLTSRETGKNDILDLMLSNMREIKQYYSISKRHARLSFALSIAFCILGFMLFTFSILNNGIKSTEPVLFGIIGGAISELFASTSLLVYRSSLTQLNQYYKTLHENERFLSIIHLVRNLSKDKQDEAIMGIINSSIKDVSFIVAKNNESK